MGDSTAAGACDDAQVGRFSKLKAGDRIRVTVTADAGALTDFVATAKLDRHDQDDESGGHAALTSAQGWTTGPVTGGSSSFLIVWLHFLATATVRVHVVAIRGDQVVREYCRTVAGKKPDWDLASEITVRAS